MKWYFRKFRVVAGMLVLSAILFTGTGAQAAKANRKTPMSISRTKLTMVEGKTYSLRITGTGARVKWKSSNKKVATVNQKGRVTAKKKGSARITAVSGNRKVTCKVTVKEKEDRWSRLLKKYKNNESVNQLVFVKYTGGSNARVMMYDKTDAGWDCILNCVGYVGKNGIAKKREGDRRTPTGTFDLTSAFGIKKNPGAKMDYVRVNRYLYWCGDKQYYNRLIDVRKTPHQCYGEHLIDYVPHYNYGMFLNYNENCVYGKGSAIFLHCTGSSKSTAGCIAVSQKNMIKIIRNAEKGAKICIYQK